MPLKILHVIAGIDPRSGGVSQAVKTMIRGLSKEGIHNEVASLDDPEASFLKAEFSIHALGPGKGPWCYSSKLLPWLNKNLCKYDVVIVHGLWLYHAYATRKATLRVRAEQMVLTPTKLPTLKMLLMPHGMLDPYFQKAPGRKIKAIRNYMYWKLLENKVVNKADGLLFTCDEELRLAHQSFEPFSPKKEVVIGLGVEEPPSFSASMINKFLDLCPKVSGYNYFLFLSRIHEKKGISVLIEAYKRILQKWSDAEIPKLVIAGPGLESTYGTGIKNLVASEKILKDSVFFTGMLTGDAKWGAFYGCEAFVLPSHQENFGIAVVESLACKKPVLISNKINIWKEIEDAGAGIVNVDTVAGTIELFEQWSKLSPEKREAMAESADRIFKKNYVVGRIAKQLVKAFH